MIRSRTRHLSAFCLVLVALVGGLVQGPDAQAFDKKFIYIDFAGIDARPDSELTATQKTALKLGILAELQANMIIAVGAGNVEVTADPTKKTEAIRHIQILNEHNPTFAATRKRAWGGRVKGSKVGKVYLKNFLDIQRAADPFKTDGKLDINKLRNAIEHTAAHELAHTFGVGHNNRTGNNVNKMTKGKNYDAIKKAEHNWHYDGHINTGIRKNFHRPASQSSVDYEIEVLSMNYCDEPTGPGESEELGGLDVSFNFSGTLAGEFDWGFFGADSDGGLNDGDAEFDFLYKSSMEGLGEDADLITFFTDWDDQTQFLLEGKTGGVYDGQWFILDEAALYLDNFVVQPDGDIVARTVLMEWDIDGIPGADVTVFLDANAFGANSDPCNGFQYGIVPEPSSLLLLGSALAAFCGCRRRWRSTRKLKVRC